jgi:hypothetical protein
MTLLVRENVETLVAPLLEGRRELGAGHEP